ncbi:NAD(P)H-dependent glycerol-3-phosphate dehydrogenase [Methylotenera sp.]|uniref:NAD(P)H-dependent glycerol-3-phosphate dehydrogenase n=2 Tax=Methylotenera sp. TaxID=2051956 RepID=UPI00272452DE|nr:NAD(P)H-dependent glycerol-3-phosphate dehydrogenase [Methylotenera sp.]MDO9204990.1 NAD(P)H-dependent glycerol-3-phosphate dehydrogenase [Methylotenera sp.]MDP1523539.1 NAD(P)H-dependent glycerol-3-phosphate dehydrogenase [Methylotenera sp.]MDP2071178.1 NAD(P)H-dependent glycerol-3-phosphate dehydrogenase [Methylotenera sp.]MDP3007341.1 NAD(P)H-dependent glycerol-3-phosphate dehydrogenase [Methylotenera sp.]MDP3307170.1 NAD(P)H-dependent glycerol-3-phosphate dehydrogenase [Methylotenera sp
MAEATNLKLSGSKIAVLGAGAWGTALAMNISQRHQVSLWARNAGHVSGMRKARANPMYLGDFKFNDQLQVEDDLQTALNGADLILSVVPTAGFRAILKDIKALGCKLPIIWAHKGLEPLTAKLPYEVALEELGDPKVTGQHWGALSGPSFAAELVRGLPTAVTLAANDESFASEAALLIHGANLRVYHTTDVIGVSVGGAVKNVMAIAAGISDGMGFGNNARAALITRGLAEMTRFGLALGASTETFMGLAGAGDLILTCTGQYSRNREVGLQLASGKSLADILQGLGHVAEGVNTAREVMRRANTIGVDMPITYEVNQALSNGKSAKDAVNDLLGREQKPEAL